MPFLLEIAGRFDGPRNCGEILHAPVAADARFRETRVYNLDFTGDAKRLRRFVTAILVDPLSHIAHFGSRPFYDDFSALVDVSLKPHLLDLERECILAYQRRSAPEGFRLNGLSIIRRFYLLGRAGPEILQRFLRDLVNPAIHQWSVAHG